MYQDKMEGRKPKKTPMNKEGGASEETVVLRRREKITGNLVLTTELKRRLATVKSWKADVSSVSPSSDRLEEL